MKGLPIEKTVDWVKRAKEYSNADDGEQMFCLIFEIWKTAQGEKL